MNSNRISHELDYPVGEVRVSKSQKYVKGWLPGFARLDNRRRLSPHNYFSPSTTHRSESTR